MQKLWQLEKALVNDILELFEPRTPAYNSVSTIIRLLEKKAFGKTHQYYPLISNSEYSRTQLNYFKKNFFDGSLSKMVSFFAKQKD
jgi:BlaI family penicillinase repressor